MLTTMTEEDWTIVLKLFELAVASRRQGPRRPEVSRSPKLFRGSHAPGLVQVAVETAAITHRCAVGNDGR